MAMPCTVGFHNRQIFRYPRLSLPLPSPPPTQEFNPLEAGLYHCVSVNKVRASGRGASFSPEALHQACRLLKPPPTHTPTHAHTPPHTRTRAHKQTRAVNHNPHPPQGCYIGQETLSKLSNTDGVKQQLWGLQLSQRAAPGAQITRQGTGERAGVLTSVVNLLDSGHFGLGYIKCKSKGAQVDLNGAEGKRLACASGPRPRQRRGRHACAHGAGEPGCVCCFRRCADTRQSSAASSAISLTAIP